MYSRREVGRERPLARGRQEELVLRQLPQGRCPQENNGKLFPREAQLTGAGGGSQARLEIPCTRQCMGDKKTAKYTPYKEHGKMKEVPNEHRQQARLLDGKWSDFSIPKP
jgi:hypothetical protein